MIEQYILEIDSTGSRQAVKIIGNIWGDVVDSITTEMIAYVKLEMDDLHIDLRPEMTLELAKLRNYLARQVVTKQIKGRAINEIDPQLEREECFNENGRERIVTTAQEVANFVWLKLYKQRWKPKTQAILKRNQSKTKRTIIPKVVGKNHFIPKSFIKRYWSEGQRVFRNIKRAEGLIEKLPAPLGGWGYRHNIYTDYLEAYFGLLEGDVVRPIAMILNIEPLNDPQREVLAKFMFIQKLRNPHFIDSFTNGPKQKLKLIIEKEEIVVGTRSWADLEGFFSVDEFYPALLEPILKNRWVVVRSKSSDFVLPDVCNLFGQLNGEQYVVMPLTPKVCLIVLPISIDEPRIVPHDIKASESMVRDISRLLLTSAVEEFLSTSGARLGEAVNQPDDLLRQVLSSIIDITADD